MAHQDRAEEEGEVAAGVAEEATMIAETTDLLILRQEEMAGLLSGWVHLLCLEVQLHRPEVDHGAADQVEVVAVDGAAVLPLLTANNLLRILRAAALLPTVAHPSTDLAPVALDLVLVVMAHLDPLPDQLLVTVVEMLEVVERESLDWPVLPVMAPTVRQVDDLLPMGADLLATCNKVLDHPVTALQLEEDKALDLLLATQPSLQIPGLSNSNKQFPPGSNLVSNHSRHYQAMRILITRIQRMAEASKKQIQH